MTDAPMARHVLARYVWPDKSLYAATLLLVVGILGTLYGLLLTMFPVAYDEGAPGFVRAYPAWLTAVLSAAAAGFAAASLKRRRAWLALVGAAYGVAAFAFLGLGSVLSLFVVVFVLLSWREREDRSPRTLELDASMWPDKALAASIVMLVGAIVHVGLGTAMLIDYASFPTYGLDVTIFALLSIAIGGLQFAAAQRLYVQKGPILAVVAAILGIWTPYYVTPLLGLAAIVLVASAWREDEFRHQATELAPAA